MAFKGIEMGLVLVLVMTLLCGGAMAQSGCTSALMGLSPCLNYITGNSSTPTSTCCTSLASVVQSQPQCLCSVVNGAGSALGITVNQSLALQLPGICNVQTPPLNQLCNAAGGPTSSAASPASSPTSSPPVSSDDTPVDDTPANTVPSTSGIPSATGSKTVPSTDGHSNSAGINKSPIHFIVFILFTVSCASF